MAHMHYLHFTGILFFVISIVVGQIFRSKFTQYAHKRLRADLSGAEVAAKMLQQNGIEGVRILCDPGHLTDHYNPISKTVNLSQEVYHGRNAAALAVAAHECGHAIQDAQGYVFLRFRSAMVPALSSTSHFMPWIILLGIILVNTTPLPLMAGIALFSCTTLFSFVTLPVEFDASRRALAWIDQQGVVTSKEHQMAKEALWWAAMTYVVAALASLAQLMRLLLILRERRQ